MRSQQDWNPKIGVPDPVDRAPECFGGRTAGEGPTTLSLWVFFYEMGITTSLPAQSLFMRPRCNNAHRVQTGKDCGKAAYSSKGHCALTQLSTASRMGVAHSGGGRMGGEDLPPAQMETWR